MQRLKPLHPYLFSFNHKIAALKLNLFLLLLNILFNKKSIFTLSLRWLNFFQLFLNFLLVFFLHCKLAIKIFFNQLQPFFSQFHLEIYEKCILFEKLKKAILQFWILNGRYHFSAYRKFKFDTYYQGCSRKNKVDDSGWNTKHWLAELEVTSCKGEKQQWQCDISFVISC